MSASPDELQDDVDSIDDPEGSKTYSYAYISSLFISIVAGLVAAVRFGILTPEVTVIATVSIGWVIEYAAAGIVALFFFWTFAQVANIVGMGFVAGVVGIVARIADNYQLPDDDQGADE